MDTSNSELGRRPSLLRQVVRHSADVFDNNTGLLLIALSQAFTSLMGVFVKKLNAIDPPIPPAELIWIRMVMTWAVCVAYMTASGVPNPVLGPKEIRLLLTLRGLAGFVGLFGTYYALQYLSLSDTTVLSFLTPMCTAVTGALFLEEDLTGRQALASAFSFVGVVLIARPDFLFGQHYADGLENEAASGRVVTPGQRLGAVGVALLGVVGLTTAYTTIRAIGKRAHPMHNLAAFALVCIVIAPVAITITRTPAVVPDSFTSIAMVVAVSVCGFAAQMTMTTGLQLETAGRGTMAIYVQVIFAMAFERIFFNTVPNCLSLLGTVVILSSAVYVVLSKRSTAQQQKFQTLNEEDSLQQGLLAHEEGAAEMPLEDVELDKIARSRS